MSDHKEKDQGRGTLPVGGSRLGSELDRAIINTIRALAMEAVQKGNSGHPDMIIGMAEATCIPWSRFLKHNRANPRWLDRDRFVVSARHGSIGIASASISF